MHMNEQVVKWIERLATEKVDSGSIPGRVKSKVIKIRFHSFLAWRLLKGLFAVSWPRQLC